MMGEVKHTPKARKPRQSIGLRRADMLRDAARSVQGEARAAGNREADELADLALSAAFNSHSGYEASHGLGGGSSRAWALRSGGARWLKRGRAYLDQARAAIAKTQGQS